MTNDLPSYDQMLWPTLQALIDLGGSAAIGELDSAVIRRERWNDEQQAVIHGDGPKTEIEYRLAWTRTYLKGMGLVTNSERGVWTVTEQGRLATDASIPALHRAFVRENRRRTAAARAAKDASAASTLEAVGTGRATETSQDSGAFPDDTGSEDWRDTLLDTLMALSPPAFERVAQRLLREAGFLSATVTGRSGDGGIDGLGVYRLSLLSFPVFFQRKRYKGSVGSGAVRDFRGAMAGRGDKGLLITTGTFTADARSEATRDGAPPIDLIDGDRLCDLLREHGLGVRTTVRTVEDAVVDQAFFDSVAAG